MHSFYADYVSNKYSEARNKKSRIAPLVKQECVQQDCSASVWTLSSWGPVLEKSMASCPTNVH